MRTRAFGRVMIGGLCAALALGGTTVVTAQSASAIACDPGNLNARADIDGDDVADVVVGSPGSVDVRGSGSPSVLIDTAALGIPRDPGGPFDFGAAIAIADLDQDGCADLVIGNPSEGPTGASGEPADMQGQVHIVFGRVGGVDTSTSITLPHDSAHGDKFGNTLALTARAYGGRMVHDIYVGAPSATVNGHAEAGEVFRYTIVPGSTERVTSTLREVRSQDSPGVPGSSEKGDGFGTVLAATDRGGVLIGAPYEDVGLVRDAGAVWFLRVNSTGVPSASQSWTQNSPGISGKAERGDRFGAALSSLSGVAVVGVPDEDAGSHADTGMIQTFSWKSGPSMFSGGRGITQDTAGIPGVMEAGDRFGAAVAVGGYLICPGHLEVAVGAPGEDVGTRSDVGTVTLTAPGDPASAGCSAKTLRQGSGLAGAPEAGDQVGAVLGLVPGEIDQEDRVDRLLIGVPSEQIGAAENAGMVQPAAGRIMVNGVNHTTLKLSKGYLLGNFYGLVLASVSG